MKTRHLLATVASAGLAAPVWAADGPPIPQSNEAPTPAIATPKAFTTGVAKGRDLLDTAISASTIDDKDVAKLGARSLYEVLGSLPGLRVEAPGSDGQTAMSIRGLPLAADGTKYLQIQEDGLPVLEFGDVHFAAVDSWVRADLSLSQIQSIRGGSSSTFSSNSPGGVINLLSHTGEEEGGVVQASAGVNYEEYRLDFRYGHKLDDKTRFAVGGFFREGEGPRASGYNAFKGGQIKLNFTRDFDGGFIRLYGKYLDDRQPAYSEVSMQVTGTDANPQYNSLPGIDPRHDSLLSRYIVSAQVADVNNRIVSTNLHEGIHSISKSIGLEGQIDIAGWTINDKFRFSANSGAYIDAYTLYAFPAATSAFINGGASYRYANGPQTGQAVSPDTLISNTAYLNNQIRSMNFTVNDLRANRVWNLGAGKLTNTLGFYLSSQDIKSNWQITTLLTTLAGGGNSTLVDLYGANGNRITYGGVMSYGVLLGDPIYQLAYDVNYRVAAPYGSLNYQLGKLAVGFSARYDLGRVSGKVYSASLGGGRNGLATIDVNGDGIISRAESVVAVLPLSQPGYVGYNYGYLSYSTGVNYRFNSRFSAFARYSRGARASAERILLSGMLNASTGQLIDPATAYGTVKQAEAGVKFRSPGVSLFATGFWASTAERNIQLAADSSGATVVAEINRAYSAKGIELEGIFQHGPFGLTLGATYTAPRIDSDSSSPSSVGVRPRHQANFFFTARPQFETGRVTLGTVITGTTSSYAQDNQGLTIPGYVLFHPFVAFRPHPRVQMMVNVNNLFDKLAIYQVNASNVPASGVVGVQTLNGRTISTSLRVSL